MSGHFGSPEDLSVDPSSTARFEATIRIMCFENNK